MLRLLLLLLTGVLAAGGASATEVKLYVTQAQKDFLKGTLESISVDPLGVLRLAPRAEQLAAIEEPFLLSAAVRGDGWVVGTGNAGRVLLVTREGRVEELMAAPEPEVFAVWADEDGVVYAG
ncbi:MAG: hypothetical protein R3190_12520, partial [Thermoanaerobaculia bacterium]|nr:hypothetical protein [Thermoanaerobaculia bacterium]